MRFKTFLQEASTGSSETIKNFFFDNCTVYESDIEIHDDLTVTLHGDLIVRKGSRAKRFPCKFREIHGNIEASHCALESLIGMPEEISGDIILLDTKIKSLKFAPKKIGGDLFLTDNKELESLEGCPEDVPGNFKLADCHKLTSLVNGPKKVDKSYKVDTCDGLIGIDGLSEHIGKNLHLTNCRNLKSLKGINKTLKYCGGKLDVSGTRFESNILGVFLVNGVQGIIYDFGTGKAASAFDIIFTCLKDGKDKFDAQNELIDKGLSKFAGL